MSYNKLISQVSIECYSTITLHSEQNIQTIFTRDERVPVNLCLKYWIKHKRPHLTTLPKTEKRVENGTCSGVFLTNFTVFGNVVKDCLECLM